MVKDNPQDDFDRPGRQDLPTQLMVYPIASMAMASAIGLRVANHVFGMLMDAVTGRAPTERRNPAPVERDTNEATPPGGHLTLVPDDRSARPPSSRATARKPDDLKTISGIGPKLEQVLIARGLSSYAQIAALDEAEIAEIDSELGFAGRIHRDDWIGQAKSLASGSESGSKSAGRKRS